jgi:ParB/RepB/Spo0J family partition protein
MTTPEKITQIRIDHIHESPFNPRRVFNEAGLQELAADIKHHGLLQPVLVRPRIPELFANLGDENAVAGFELVFGHRRYRAACIAGLETLPAMVQSLTDEQVKRMQISENLEREDVHPIEEAEGFQALMRDHGLTADDLVKQTGKSRSYIYGRLKLLNACKEVRDACLAGEIGSEAALLVARIPTDKLQAKALARIKAKTMDMSDGGKRSYRDIQWLLREEFTLSLTKDCIFSGTDPDLLPSAGACTSCPKRTANAPEFADLVADQHRRWGGVVKGDPELCTDPDCYQAKKTAHLKAEAAKLAAKGEVVIDGNKARMAVSAQGEVKGGYVALADVKAELANARKAAQLDSKIVPPQVVIIQDPRSGKTFKAVKEAELVAAGTRKATPKHQREADDHKARQARDEADRKAKEAKAQHITERNYELLLRTREAMHAAQRDAADLAMVARTAVAGVGHHDREVLAKLWGADNVAQLTKKVGSMPVADLTKLLLDCALVEDTHSTYYHLVPKPDTLATTARRYGVPIDPPKPSEPLPPAALASTGGEAKAKGKANAMPYRCRESGMAWSGRGLKPKWVQAALAAGKTLADLAVGQKTDAPAALAPVGADGDGQAAAQGDTDPVLGSAEQELVEGAAAQGVDAGATEEA